MTLVFPSRRDVLDPAIEYVSVPPQPRTPAPGPAFPPECDGTARRPAGWDPHPPRSGALPPVACHSAATWRSPLRASGVFRSAPDSIRRNASWPAVDAVVGGVGSGVVVSASLQAVGASISASAAIAPGSVVRMEVTFPRSGGNRWRRARPPSEEQNVVMRSNSSINTCRSHRPR